MKKILLAAFIYLQTSCITSLHPIATYDKVFTDQRLVGTWTDQKQEFEIQDFSRTELSREFEKEMAAIKARNVPLSEEQKIYLALFNLAYKSYHVSYRKGGIEYHLLASFIKLSDDLYMNLTPLDMRSIENGNEFNLETGFKDCSTFARIEIKNNNTLIIRFPDAEWIQERILSGHARIQHEKNDLFGTFLITASSRELQQFLEKYGDDERLYSKESSVTLVRKT
jgi:hypothetical protein